MSHPTLTINVDQVGTTRRGWMTFSDLLANQNVIVDPARVEAWFEDSEKGLVSFSLSSGNTVRCVVRQDRDADADTYADLIDLVLTALEQP